MICFHNLYIGRKLEKLNVENNVGIISFLSMNQLAFFFVQSSYDLSWMRHILSNCTAKLNANNN